MPKLKPLKLNFGLNKVAKNHSWFLIRNEILVHTQNHQITPKEKVQETGVIKDEGKVY